MPHLKHLPHHPIPLRHRVPGHLGPLGDGAVIGLLGVEPHVLPDLPLLLGELLRRDEPPHPVLEGPPLGVHLRDERLQLLLARLPGVGVDALGVCLLWGKIPGVQFSPLGLKVSDIS